MNYKELSLLELIALHNNYLLYKTLQHFGSRFCLIDTRKFELIEKELNKRLQEIKFTE